MNLLQYTVEFLWGGGTLCLVTGVGLWIAWRTRWIQLRGMKSAFRALLHSDESAKGETGAFAALCTSLGATIGTGNIIGVAAAVSVGGAGALFWMAVSALLAMGLHYAEGYFALLYRTETKYHRVLGGPFYYIPMAFGGKGGKSLSFLYAVVLMLCGVCGVGTLIQSGGMYAAARDYFCPAGSASLQWGVAIVASAAGGGIIFGGLKRISRAAELLVPIMSLLYVGSLVWILLARLSALPAAFAEILQSAFSPTSLGGGIVGSVWTALGVGVRRSVLSNEAGLGTAAIAAAAAKTNSPHTQGLITMTSSLIDTLIMCSMTGLALVVTGAHKSGMFGVEMTLRAFADGLPLPPAVSRAIVTLSLILFAFSTIISWNYYGESALYFLTKRPAAQKLYRLLYLAAVFAGPFLSMQAAFSVADIGNALLLFCHLPALFILSRRLARRAG